MGKTEIDRQEADWDGWTPDQPLRLQKWELYVVYLLQGVSKSEAKQLVGYSQHTDLNHPRLTARLDFLRQATVYNTQYTVAEFQRQLAGICRTNITDVMSWKQVRIPGYERFSIHDTERDVYIDPETGEEVDEIPMRLVSTLKDSDDLDARQAAAVKKMKFKTDIAGNTTVEFEMHDKLKAIQMMGQHLGALDENRNLGAKELTIQDAERIIHEGPESLSDDDIEHLRAEAWQGRLGTEQPEAEE